MAALDDDDHDVDEWREEHGEGDNRGERVCERAFFAAHDEIMNTGEPEQNAKIAGNYGAAARDWLFLPS